MGEMEGGEQGGRGEGRQWSQLFILDLLYLPRQIKKGGSIRSDTCSFCSIFSFPYKPRLKINWSC